MTREEAFRKIEEHIDVLSNYGVIDVDVADVMKEYFFEFVMSIDSTEFQIDMTIDSIREMWERKQPPKQKPKEED